MSNKCKRCGRKTFWSSESTCHDCSLHDAVSFIVCHAYYGCDSGCCGYTIAIYDKQERLLEDSWLGFYHPEQDDFRDFAIGAAKNKYPDLHLEFNEEESSFYAD